MERSIEATTIVDAGSDTVGELLMRDAGTVVGGAAMLSATVLHCPSARREVTLTVGGATSTEDGIAVPLSWEAADHPTLFPTFRGELVVTPSVAGTRLQLIGTYCVPLGPLGRFGDGVLGRRFVQRSLHALLEDIAGRIDDALGTADAEVERSVQVVEQCHSEIYIG